MLLVSGCYVSWPREIKGCTMIAIMWVCPFEGTTYLVGFEGKAKGSQQKIGSYMHFCRHNQLSIVKTALWQQCPVGGTNIEVQLETNKHGFSARYTRLAKRQRESLLFGGLVSFHVLGVSKPIRNSDFKSSNIVWAWAILVARTRFVLLS